MCAPPFRSVGPVTHRNFVKKYTLELPFEAFVNNTGTSAHQAYHVPSDKCVPPDPRPPNHLPQLCIVSTMQSTDRVTSKAHTARCAETCRHWMYVVPCHKSCLPLELGCCSR